MARRVSESTPLKKALSPFKRRATTIAIVEYISLALTLILIYICVCMGVAFIFPFIYIKEWILWGSLVIFATAMTVSFVKKPNWDDVAKALDGHGLEERIITALELEDERDVFANTQRMDTLCYLESTSPAVIKFNIPKGRMQAIIGLSIAIIILFVLPNPKWDLVERYWNMRESIEEMAKEIEKEGKEKVARADELSDEEKEEITRLLSSLAGELEQSKEYKEAVAKISKTQDAIDEYMQKRQKERIDMLSSVLKEQDATASLGAAIEANDTEAVRDEIDKLKRQLQEGLDRDKIAKDLSTALKAAAHNMPDGGLKDEINEMATMLSEFKSDEQTIEYALEELEELQSALVDNMCQGGTCDPGDIKYLLQDMKNSAIGGADALASHSGGSNAPDQMSGGQTGQGSDTSQGSGTAQGNSTGGQGAGEGQGQGGGIGKTGHSSAVGESHRLGGEAQVIENVQGNPTASGKVDTIEIEGGIGGTVGPIPYNKVVGTYRRQALEALDRKALPQGLENIVKDYFKGLEE